MDTENLFEDKASLHQMIDFSGGCIRDLFRMVAESSEVAQDFDRQKISAEDCKRAIQKLKRDYENNIADLIEDGEVTIPVQEFYDALTKLATDPNKKIDNTQVVMQLRQNLSVLGYNGEQWYDVHPAIRVILKERGKI